MTISVSETPNYTTRSVERAFDVLALIGSHPASLRDVAVHLGLNRSTAYKTLAALEVRGYVRRDPDSAVYFLGAKILQLATLYREQNPLIKVARPYLETLLRETRETVHLCVREGLSSACVDRIDSPQSIKLSVKLGETTPLHVTAAAKAILAYSPGDIVAEVLKRPLQPFTSNTITDPDCLREELETIRRRGFAKSDGELTPGARSVTAAIFDASNHAIGSVGVSGPSSRLPEEVILRYATTVTEVAARISGELHLKHPIG
ncbi:MAG: IclR family transcriptional regulator [Ardenticatenaceae bacterium]|nr:IclR family transcriptional regulator [Ardenticatenaceae bacterium]